MPYQLVKLILLCFISLVSVSCTDKFETSAPSEPSSSDNTKKPRAGSRGQLSNQDYANVSADETVAVATVNPLATQVALDIANSGGNAIDAALAAAFTLGVVDSHNSGIGGGCFILVHLASGEVLAIDGREMAPAKAHRDMYIVDGKYNARLSKTGALASGIPGSVMALYQLQKLGGKKRFSDALLPGAKIAEDGFPIDNTLAKRLARTAADIKSFESTAAIFLNDKKEVLKVGDTLRQKDLAYTYRQLAKHGPDWFYNGEFAQFTAEWMAKNGGIITAKDFANYEIVKRSPIKSSFEGYTIYGFPPPSSGGVHVAQILNILSHFDLAKHTTNDRYHLLAESMKLAFADRAYWLGDSDFVPVPKGLYTKEYAATLAKKININHASEVAQHNVPPNAAEDIFSKHTTHIATADKHGNWVAITTTLNTSFGSKVVVPGTGVLLNNQMDDFSGQPGTPNAFGLVGAEANSIAPGKRPLSSMSPTLVLKDGKPVMTIGAAGGPTIITQVVQALVYKLSLGEDLLSAVAGPRVHQQWRPDIVLTGDGVSEDALRSLEGKGHKIRDAGDFGGTQAIALEEGKLIPVAEPRVVRRNNKLDK